MDIFVRKGPKHQMFRPHANRTTGKYYHTWKDMKQDLKSRGEELYSSKDIRNPQAPKKSGASKWAHEMVEAAKQQGWKPGDRWKEEVAKHGKFKAPSKDMIDKANSKDIKGGFKAE